MNDKIFSGLEDLGFNNIEKIDLYKKEEEEVKKEENNKEQEQLKEKNMLYEKEVTCPICENTFKVKAVKTSSYRMVSKDSDFFIRYNLINPYFYDVWICPRCGYSATKTDFNKIKSYQIELVNKNIRPKWNKKQYPDVYDVDIAIERYKLALLTSVITKCKASRKAMICLKIAWMYRIKNEKEHEQIFIQQALEGFNDAYLNEDTPIYGMDNFTILYLLGELNRRVGNYEAALGCFSKVVTNVSAPHRVKELARDQKDLIREDSMGSQDETGINVDSEEDVKESKRGFFSKLFGK